MNRNPHTPKAATQTGMKPTDEVACGSASMPPPTQPPAIKAVAPMKPLPRNSLPSPWSRLLLHRGRVGLLALPPLSLLKSFVRAQCHLHTKLPSSPIPGSAQPNPHFTVPSALDTLHPAAAVYSHPGRARAGPTHARDAASQGTRPRHAGGPQRRIELPYHCRRQQPWPKQSR
eukprot:scaffold4274_cov376-Prasinococcus_capsulatus_cf.AAC.2